MATKDWDKKSHLRIKDLVQRARDLGFEDSEIRDLFKQKTSINNHNKNNNNNNNSFKTKDNYFENENRRLCLKTLKLKLICRKLASNIFHYKLKQHLPSKAFVFSFFVIFLAYMFYTPAFWKQLREEILNFVDEPCLLDEHPFKPEIIRPQVPCGICKDLKEVPVVFNISKTDFAKHYAFTGVPVLIKGAISDWSALNNFKFQYFKKIYLNSSDSLQYIEENCQFFNYQTEFESLKDVFQMPKNRATFKNGTRPWYIGWSNCDANRYEAGIQLRKEYTKPYFLPTHSSGTLDDWIFMGGPGFGSGMHIDHVNRPSWQAQISGSKTWRLEPSPECWSECHNMEITVEKGDIIVLDTNIWYHSTRVNPGNISITIGSEYD